MMILAQFWFILNALLKVTFIIKDPSENRILNFLVVFLLKEVVMEEVH